MTEAEWLASGDPTPMLEFLQGRASNRRLRLFSVACCRQIWDLLDTAARNAVEVGEQFADGIASDAERHQAFVDLMAVSGATSLDSTVHYAMNWATPAVVAAAIACSDGSESLTDSLGGRFETGLGEGGDSVYRALSVGEHLIRAQWFACDQQRRLMRQSYSRIVRTLHSVMDHLLPADSLLPLANKTWHHQVGLIHDIFGPYPLRPVLCDRGWHTGTIAALAQGIYDDRAFDRLPILADALEDAGCTNADILNHCRQPGEHVRGCWVVDLVLGRE